MCDYVTLVATDALLAAAISKEKKPKLHSLSKGNCFDMHVCIHLDI